MYKSLSNPNMPRVRPEAKLDSCMEFVVSAPSVTVSKIFDDAGPACHPLYFTPRHSVFIVNFSPCKGQGGAGKAKTWPCIIIYAGRAANRYALLIIA
jgi:hypothetical protein